MINAAPAVATAATTARKAMVRSVGAGVRPARRPDRGRTEATEALSRARCDTVDFRNIEPFTVLGGPCPWRLFA